MPHSKPEERDYAQDQRDHEQNRRDDQKAMSNAITRTDERVNALERWQVAQNGSLLRIEEKIDAEKDKSAERFGELQKWLMGAMLTALTALAAILFKH